MVCATNGAVFEVSMVKADVNGVVLHTGNFSTGSVLRMGDIVTQKIDEKLRRLFRKFQPLFSSVEVLKMSLICNLFVKDCTQESIQLDISSTLPCVTLAQNSSI